MDVINNLYKEWLTFQPLKSEYQKRLDQKFMLEFNYNSNHLEGNTLTYGQTKLLLMFGETSGDAKLRDYEEMKAHNVGLELTKREAKDKERPLTENFIRELNRTILVEDFYKTQKTENGITRYKIKVGQYKTRPNSVITVTGELFEYASPEETPALMKDLVEWYNKTEKSQDLHPIELAALFHYRYIRIHPFEDGNGRIARLLVNYILHRHDYPMIIIKSDDKENYLNILHQCDVVVGLTSSQGATARLEDIRKFVIYLQEQLEYALVISIKAAKGENIEEEGDLEKKVSLLKRKIVHNFDKTQLNKMDYFVKNSITPLITDWYLMTTKFDYLFKERINYISIIDFNDNSWDFDIIHDLINSSQYRKTWKELYIDTIYTNFNEPELAIDVSVPSLEIKISSSNYSIIVNNDKDFILKKSIDELLSEEDIKEIVKYGADLLLQVIHDEIDSL
jgi:Fic family protein